jgi:Mce-associated membrane protein
VTPTWYDLLGVDPAASGDEIRAAWKAGIADLDPGDRRFRSLNEAAEVLLDRDRRAAYDASLEPEPEPPSVEPVETSAGKAPAEPPTGPRRSVPAWLLAVLAVLTALMVTAAGYLVSQPSDDAIASATSEAQGAAERAVVTILAYDYRHLDDDQKAAGALMTPDYKKEKYDPLFAVIKENAPGLKAVVTVQVVASGIIRSGDDRVQVLVFVNRPTTNKESTQPTVYRDQVRMTMVNSGDEWLVDNMQTGPTSG